MRQSTLKFLSVGLLIGTIVGCGKAGPGGVEGLCEKLLDCGAMTTEQQCASAVASCPNADAQADECLKNDDCGQVAACYTLMALSCTPNPGTSGATEVETDSAGTGPTEASAGTTSVDTIEPTDTSSPATSMTTDVDPDTTSPSGTETTSPSGTETTSPETTDPSTTGGGDAFFGACDMMTPCPNGEDCLAVQDVEGFFCSPACETQGDACPGYPGSGMALCLLSTDMMPATNCVVLCMSDADCLEDMTCKEVPMGMGAMICSSP